MKHLRFHTLWRVILCAALCALLLQTGCTEMIKVTVKNSYAIPVTVFEETRDSDDRYVDHRLGTVQPHTTATLPEGLARGSNPPLKFKSQDGKLLIEMPYPEVNDRNSISQDGNWHFVIGP